MDINFGVGLRNYIFEQNDVITRDEIVNIFESGTVFTSDFDINSIPKEILPAWEFFKQNTLVKSPPLRRCASQVNGTVSGTVQLLQREWNSKHSGCGQGGRIFAG